MGGMNRQAGASATHGKFASLLVDDVLLGCEEELGGQGRQRGPSLRVKKVIAEERNGSPPSPPLLREQNLFGMP
ncbi:hypothetical protein MTO96_012125 [Rhipicephalus appendiculatus]